MKNLFLSAFLSFFFLSILHAQNPINHSATTGVPLPNWRPNDIEDANATKSVEYPIFTQQSSYPYPIQHTDSPKIIVPPTQDILSFPMLEEVPLEREKNSSDLTLVPNVRYSPYRYNVLVIMEDEEGRKYECSGALIDARMVLLSGKCVYDKTLFNGLARNIKVIPTYDYRFVDLFGYAYATVAHLYNGWTINGSLNHNIAYLELDRPIGAALNWLKLDENDDRPYSFGNETADTYNNKNFVNSSYPKDNSVETGRLYTRNVNVNRVEQFAVYHKSTALSRQAGSPLYLPESNDKVSAVVSHISGNSIGYARVTEGKAKDIQDDIKAMTPTSPDLYPLAAPAFPRFINKQQKIGTLIDTLVLGVANYSTKNYQGDVEWVVILSKDQFFSNNDILVGNLVRENIFISAKGGHFTDVANRLTIPSNVEAGNYYIGYYILVEDANRNNNFPLIGDMQPIIISNSIACSEAIPLECDQSYTFSNNNASNNFNNDNDLYGNCLGPNFGLPPGNDYDAKDLLFSFELETTSNVSIQLDKLTASFDAFLFKKCENGQLFKCEGFGTRGGTFSETINLNNAVGTYYLVVDGTKSNQIGQFDLTITSSTCGDAGDICTNATTLSCGETGDYTTVGADNSFVYKDYEGSCTERIGAENNPFDAADRLFKFDVTETSDVNILMSDLTADLDLFIFKGCNDGSLNQCIARSISFDTANEEILIENASGTYYLIVDGYEANQVSSFSLSLSCPSSEANFASPSICNLGADFLTNGANNINNLNLNGATDYPLSYLANQECVINSFDEEEDIADYAFDAYVTYLEASDTLEITVDRSRYKAFAFTCNVDPASGKTISKCILTGERKNGDIVLSIVNRTSEAEFYYIAIAGDVRDGSDFFNESYDLALLPDGPCGANVRSLDLYDDFDEDETERPDTLFADDYDDIDPDDESKFDRDGSSNSTAYDCPNLSYPYTGGEKIYQFTIEEQSVVEVALEAEDLYGIFLYDSDCGSNCRGFSESELVDEVQQLATLKDTLSPGIYFLIVDKAFQSNRDSEFYVSIKTYTNTSTFFESGCALFAVATNDESLQKSAIEDSHKMRFSENMKRFKINGRGLNQRDVFAFFYPKEENIEISGPVAYNPNVQIELLKNTLPSEEKCGYDEGDEIIIKMDNQQDQVYNIKARYDRNYSYDGLFKSDSLSIIDSLETGNNLFKTTVNAINLGTTNTASFYVFSNKDWTVSDASPSLIISPKEGLGVNTATLVRISLNPNAPNSIADGFITFRQIDESIVIDDFYSSFNTRTVRVRRNFNAISINEPAITHIAAPKKVEVNIVPNPAQAYFNITLPSNLPVQRVQIIDSFGKMLYKRNIEHGSVIRINTDNMSAGIYFVKIFSDREIITRKVLVQQ